MSKTMLHCDHTLKMAVRAMIDFRLYYLEEDILLDLV